MESKGSDHTPIERRPEPVRRVYASRAGAPKDRDAFEAVTRFRLLGWSLVGAFLGFLLGVFLGVQGQAGGVLILVMTMLGGVMSYYVPRLILHGAGRAGSTLYAPSGGSTPHKREYSLAESYAARGEYAMAVAAFEDAISEGPNDPVPYIQVARMMRDRMSDPEGAAAWFKRGLAESAMKPGQRLLTCRELVELYERIGKPEKAAPLLARIAAQYPDDVDGQWATEALVDIKRGMRGEVEGGESSHEGRRDA